MDQKPYKLKIDGRKNKPDLKILLDANSERAKLTEIYLLLLIPPGPFLVYVNSKGSDRTSWMSRLVELCYLQVHIGPFFACYTSCMFLRRLFACMFAFLQLLLLFKYMYCMTVPTQLLSFFQCFR